MEIRRKRLTAALSTGGEAFRCLATSSSGVLYMIPTLFGMSLISFLIIQLPPGDYLTSMIATMSDSGQAVDPAQIERLKQIYGFDDPFCIQYLQVDLGHRQPRRLRLLLRVEPAGLGLIWARMGSTLVISLLSLLFVWIVALPIGIYSAVRRHSIGDHVFTFFGFIGLAVPNFILALTLMYIAYRYLGQSVGGLNSRPNMPKRPGASPRSATSSPISGSRSSSSAPRARRR